MSRVEAGLNVVLLLAALTMLMALYLGGAPSRLSSWSLPPLHLRGPLLVLVTCVAAKAWVRDQRLGRLAEDRLRSPLLLFLLAVFIYSLNGRTAETGDAIPARYLPLSLLREWDFDLDEFPFLRHYYPTPELPYFLQEHRGHLISAYPPWAAVLALPVYVIPVLGGLSPQSHILPELEKLAATLLTSLSVVCLYLTLRRLTRVSLAWLIALIYAFGTSSLSTSSQALWQHGPGQLFLTLAMYYLVRDLAEPHWAPAAGFALAIAVLCRPLNVLIALPLGVYLLRERRNQLWRTALAALPACLLLLAYNQHSFGSPVMLGFAGLPVTPTSLWAASGSLFRTPLEEGLVGLLASPSRGLLIYSPIFLISFIGMGMAWRKRSPALLKYLSLTPFPLILVVAKWESWWGGHCYGPRLLAELSPILCLYLYPPLERLVGKPLFTWVFTGLVALSIGVHGLGIASSANWNKKPNITFHPERLWSWRDSPPVFKASALLRALKHTVRRGTERSFPPTSALARHGERRGETRGPPRACQDGGRLTVGACAGYPGLFRPPIITGSDIQVMLAGNGVFATH